MPLKRRVSRRTWQIGGVGTFLLGIVFAVVVLVYFGSRHDNHGETSTPRIGSATNSATDDPIATLKKTTPSNLQPEGELAAIFAYGSDHTDLQRQLKLKEILRKVVERNLPVYEIKQSGNGYIIQTSAKLKGDHIGKKLISTFIHITPQSESDKRLIEGLKTGDVVKFKGIVEDTVLRSLVIKPAILLREPPLRQLMTETYGKYDSARKCWYAPDVETANGKVPYCVKVIRTETVALPTGDQIYVLALGEVTTDGAHADDHTHDDPSFVGLFLLKMRDDQFEIIASEPKLFEDPYVRSTVGWTLVQLGRDYWGWKGETGGGRQGYFNSLHMLLAVYGNEIRDLANGLQSGKSNIGAVGAETGTAIRWELSIDQSQSNAQVFPLNLTVTGVVEGKKINPKTFTVPFDTKKWIYVPPKDMGLKGVDTSGY